MFLFLYSHTLLHLLLEGFLLKSKVAGDINLNSGPKNNLQPLNSNKWNVFKSKGLHLIHLNINSLLSKIDELRYIANSSNAAVIGISEYKLDESVLQSEI